MLLVHGWLGSAYSMIPLVNRFRLAGWPAFAVPGLNFNTNNVEDLVNDSQAIVEYVNSFDTKVNIVGYSLGGVSGRYSFKILGISNKVANFVSVDSPQHGAEFYGVGTYLYPGSPLLTQLNLGDETPSPTHWTAIAGREFGDSAKLTGANNVFLDKSHIELIFSDEAFNIALQAIGG